MRASVQGCIGVVLAVLGRVEVAEVVFAALAFLVVLAALTWAVALVVLAIEAIVLEVTLLLIAGRLIMLAAPGVGVVVQYQLPLASAQV